MLATKVNLEELYPDNQEYTAGLAFNQYQEIRDAWPVVRMPPSAIDHFRNPLLAILAMHEREGSHQHFVTTAEHHAAFIAPVFHNFNPVQKQGFNVSFYWGAEIENWYLI